MFNSFGGRSKDSKVNPIPARWSNPKDLGNTYKIVKYDKSRN